MANIVPYPNCCGASIIQALSFSGPDTVTEWEMEEKQTKWGPTTTYKLDEAGNRIPKKTMKDIFIALKEGNLEDKKRFPAYGGNQNYYKDHGFLVIINDSQIKAGWLPVLKEAGFLFMCQWNNTVHNTSPNYLFVLPRHTSRQKVPDPLTPPKGWLELQEEPVSKAA